MGRGKVRVRFWEPSKEMISRRRNHQLPNAAESSRKGLKMAIGFSNEIGVGEWY